MKKAILTILILFLNINLCFAASNYTLRTYDVETSDGHLLKAYLSYPKTKHKTYPTILMLHSLGYPSNYWQPLEDKFNQLGFAVLKIDFRGHGKSVYNKNFRMQHWTKYKNDTFMKYPKDVVEVIDYVKKQTKKADFNNWAIIGADIGANTAVLVAKKYPVKPKALVLISPSMTFKGLYIPVAMTEIGYTPILAMACEGDKYSMQEQEKLSKFAQGTFDILNTKSGGSGMLIIKKYPEMQSHIVNWINKYFK